MPWKNQNIVRQCRCAYVLGENGSGQEGSEWECYKNLVFVQVVYIACLHDLVH